MVNLFCIWTCGPRSADIIAISHLPQNILNITAYVDISVANAIYASCEDRCLTFGQPRTVAQEYGNSIAFIESFSSANEPGFTPGVGSPYFQYVIGTNPASSK